MSRRSHTVSIFYCVILPYRVIFPARCHSFFILSRTVTACNRTLQKKQESETHISTAAFNFILGPVERQTKSPVWLTSGRFLLLLCLTDVTPRTPPLPYCRAKFYQNLIYNTASFLPWSLVSRFVSILFGLIVRGHVRTPVLPRIYTKLCFCFQGLSFLARKTHPLFQLQPKSFSSLRPQFDQIKGGKGRRERKCD